MQSAPATVPPTIEVTFAPACAPALPATVSRRSASSPSPARPASRLTGSNPAREIRFGSSNAAESPRTYETIACQRCPLDLAERR